MTRFFWWLPTNIIVKNASKFKFWHILVSGLKKNLRFIWLLKSRHVFFFHSCLGLAIKKQNTENKMKYDHARQFIPIETCKQQNVCWRNWSQSFVKSSTHTQTHIGNANQDTRRQITKWIAQPSMNMHRTTKTNTFHLSIGYYPNKMLNCVCARENNSIGVVFCKYHNRSYVIRILLCSVRFLNIAYVYVWKKLQICYLPHSEWGIFLFEYGVVWSNLRKKDNKLNNVLKHKLNG